jgi:hypothetical protein
MAHKFAGKKVRDILRAKKAGVRTAPLPSGSPDWTEFEAMTWEDIEVGAAENRPGFKTVRKLLTDRRFDR